MHRPGGEPGHGTGLNLWSSGHAPEAFLMAMDGRILHRWRRAYAELPGALPLEHTSQNAWRRVRLLPEGALLTLHEGLGLTLLDRDSRIQWHFPGRAHHDLDLDDAGRILVLTREARLIPHLNPTEPILEDSITTLAGDGSVLACVSLLDCLANSPYAATVRQSAQRGGDLLHTNTLDLLDEGEAACHPSFRAGQVLVCFRDLDAIAVVDLERTAVVWMTGGDWAAPHQPVVLPGGTLLIFDNMGHHGFSKVLEFDPLDGRELWSYSGAPPSAFFSIFCGAAQRLEGGTTLITESCRGRALEVDRAGRIVWQYASPHRAGAEGQFVAALYEMQRIPEEFVAPWLER